MVDKQARMKSNDPEQPIDYNQSSLNIFEALSRYSLFEREIAVSILILIIVLNFVCLFLKYAER